uniref:IQ motif containing K n=1 Tax=Hippocampus comes TaxID=109280 RepID=A0A3Q2ZKZ1_HIPCM
YMEEKLFPVLVPALEAVLKEAERQGCLQVCSLHLTIGFFANVEFHNPRRQGQPPRQFNNIPFVRAWLSMHDEQAALIIQSFWRGYKVRAQPHVQELRQWQMNLRVTRDIPKAVSEFWARIEKRGERKRIDVDELDCAESAPRSRSSSTPTPSPT